MDNQSLELTPIAAAVPATQQSLPVAVSQGESFLLALVDRGAKMDELERIMDLRDRMDAKAAVNAFNEALAAFKTEAITIIKSKAVGYETANGGFVGYKHAELFNVVDAVVPVLARYGLSHRWNVKQSKDWISVECILSHKDGHSERCEMGGPPDNSGKKNALQQIASTVSYLQRYTLKAITGVAEGGEDDDGAASGEPQEQAPAAARQSNVARNLDAKAAARIAPEELAAHLAKVKAASTAAEVLKLWKELGPTLANTADHETVGKAAADRRRAINAEADAAKAAAAAQEGVPA